MKRIPTQSECLSYGYYGFAIYLMLLFTLEVWVLLDHPELVNTNALVLIMGYPAGACADLYFKRS